MNHPVDVRKWGLDTIESQLSLAKKRVSLIKHVCPIDLLLINILDSELKRRSPFALATNKERSDIKRKLGDI